MLRPKLTPVSLLINSKLKVVKLTYVFPSVSRRLDDKTC